MLYPAILVFICLGVYSVNNNTFDVMLVVFFGLVGYIMMMLRFEPAPLLLGFILGPLMEENLRRALLISRGDMSVFIQRPISATLMGITLLMLLWALWVSVRGRSRQNAASTEG
jgi:TctA family transporter